jgi:hypothetical protein
MRWRRIGNAVREAARGQVAISSADLARADCVRRPGTLQVVGEFGARKPVWLVWNARLGVRDYVLGETLAPREGEVHLTTMHAKGRGDPR